MRKPSPRQDRGDGFLGVQKVGGRDTIWLGIYLRAGGESGMYQEYEVVKLTKTLQAERLVDGTSGSIARGTTGTIVMIYSAVNGQQLAYEVEFFDDQKDTIAVVTVEADEIEPLVV